MALLLFIAVFLVSLISVFFTAKKMKKLKVLGRDINKKEKVFLPEATGIALLVPLWLGILYIVFFENYNPAFIILALAVTGFSIIGLLDDLKKIFGNISWKKRAGPVALFSLVFAFLFTPDFLWVPFLAVYIAGIASLQNTFAGMNGWEIGSGFIISCFVVILLLSTQFFLPAIVLCAMVLGLLFWNFFPAKVFPGDSGTLLIGGMIAGIMVETENVLLMGTVFLFFIPHLIDFFLLKLRTNKKDVSQKAMFPYELDEKQRIKIPEYKDKSQRLDFAKLIIKIFGPKKEWWIVLLIWIFVFLNCLLWFFVFQSARELVF